MWVFLAANTSVAAYSLGTLGASVFGLEFRPAILTIIFFQPPLFNPCGIFRYIRSKARPSPANSFPVLVLPLLSELLFDHPERDRVCWMEYGQLYNWRFDPQSGQRRKSTEDSQRGCDYNLRRPDARPQFHWIQICARVPEILVGPHDYYILHRLGIVCQVFHTRFLGGCSDKRHRRQRFEFRCRDRGGSTGVEFARGRLYCQFS